MIKKILIITAVFSTILLAMSPAQAAEEEFNSSTNQASVGEPVPSMIELGSVNPGIYDTTITVLEVVRGKQAMKFLKKASSKNKKPPKGREYLLAKVKFSLKSRVLSDRMSMSLGDNPLQWVAMTSKLTDYPPVSVTVPKPALTGKVKPGESMEGWVAFAVEKNDRKPVMVFNPDSGGATGRGRTLFFKLY